MILILCLWLLPFGIYGVVAADIIFGLMMNVMNYRSIYRAIRFKLEIKCTFLLPAVSSVLMGIAAWGTWKGLYILLKSNTVAVLLAICVAVAVYAVALLLTGAISESDLKAFPKGALLVKIAKKLHLLRKTA